jgi:D-xylose transport system substrate-binding protein
MFSFRHHSRAYIARTLFMSVCLLMGILLTACSTGGTTDPNAKGPYAANGGKGCTKVGILLPETTSSVRWETKDHPLLVQAVKKAIPNATIDYNNGQDNETTQIKQAEADLANGDCILIVAPHDSVTAATIVAKAKAQNVPVIAYDRLIQSKDLTYYVSFDNMRVGQLQGNYIAQHYQQYEKNGVINIALINGSQTDNNALLFSEGAHQALDPLLANGTLQNIAETFTPDWTEVNAQAEMEAMLVTQQNNVQIAYVANDGMADGVINALKTVNMNGKVLVTGQDATLAGIRNILSGDQNMTVYKPTDAEATSTGNLVKAIYDGTPTDNLTQGHVTTTYNGGKIPSILDVPISIDRSNIASTVLKDNFLTKNDICAGFPAGTDGIC